MPANDASGEGRAQLQQAESKVHFPQSWCVSSLCHETANLPLLLLSAQRLAKVEMHGNRGCSSHPEGWAWGHLCVWDDALIICKERTSQDTLFPSSERREVFPPILSSQQKLQNQKGQGRLQSPCSELLLLLTDSTDGP